MILDSSLLSESELIGRDLGVKRLSHASEFDFVDI